MFHVEHLDAIATDIQYEGHIERQKKQAEKIIRMENKTIPSDIDYEHVHALKKEAVIKLGNIRPATIGQASRIPGITPADIACCLCICKNAAGNKHNTPRFLFRNFNLRRTIGGGY